MRLYLIVAGVVLLLVACVGAWYAVHSPAFWGALAVAVIGAMAPMLKASPETVERNRDDTRRRVDRTITGREKDR